MKCTYCHKRKGILLGTHAVYNHDTKGNKDYVIRLCHKCCAIFVKECLNAKELIHANNLFIVYGEPKK